MDSYIDSLPESEFVSDIGELTPTLTSHDAPLIDLSKVIADTIINPVDGEEFSCEDDLSDLVGVFNPCHYTEEDRKTDDNFYDNRYHDNNSKKIVSSTPINAKTEKKVQVTPKDGSFVLDTRFNDSLSGLLGSPPPGSSLANNPFFEDLQAILASDCSSTSDSFPRILFETLTTQPHSDIFTREQQLETRFNELRAKFPQDVDQLANMYKEQAGLVEKERFRVLHEIPLSADQKQSTNLHYDVQLHSIMDRVEQSVRLLENANTAQPVTSSRVIKPRPLLSKKAIRIMEEWYEENLSYPYPTPDVIAEIAEKGAINVDQVKKWYANKRNRSNNTRTLTEIAKKKRQLAFKH